MAVTVKQRFLPFGGDQVRDLRRQETLEAGQPLDFGNLRFHPFFQGAVQFPQLARLRLHLVVELSELHVLVEKR